MKQTSRAKLSGFLQSFKEKVCALKVNETKPTSRKAIFFNHVATGCEESSKSHKRAPF